ncbi:MAG: hypothetical protein JSW52_11620 [Candidatus Coatesbacteria bacterium]|nr:MAG: hypothetical protein JSW52_11620 [Candidatus Coatesbacteria bacterium]
MASVAAVALLWLVAYLGAGAFVAALAARLGFVPMVAVALLFYAGFGLLLARFGLRRIAPLARVARLLRDAEEKRPAFRRRLAAAVDLAREPRFRGTSPELAGSFVESVAAKVEDIPAGLPAAMKVRAGAAFSSITTLWAVAFLAFPGLFGGLRTGLGELAATVEGRNIVEVKPGDASVQADVQIEISARVQSEPEFPLSVHLDKNGELSEIEMTTDGDWFRASIHAGREDFDYWIISGDERTDRFHVDVKLPPRITDLQVTVYPPAYSGLPPDKPLAGAGDVSALPGSRVHVTAAVSPPETDVVNLEMKGGDPVPAIEADGRFEASFIVCERAAYRLTAESKWGIGVTPYFAINPTVDLAPTVEVIEPEGDIEIADPYPSPVLRFRASDDFGISRAVVKYYNETTGERYEKEVSSAAGGRELEASGDIIFPGLDIFPGDVIDFYVEVYDNDTVNGPKVGRSPVYHVRFPTAAEIFDDLNAEMAEELASFADIQSDVGELEERFAEMGGVGDEAGRPDRAAMRELIEEQERIKRELAEAARELEAALERADEGLISPELAEKMWQVSEMLEAALDEEAKEALEKLREAMLEVDPEKIAELMEGIQFDQEMLAERLDRMLEILESALREQTLSELALRAEELANRQDEILRELEDDGPSLDLAAEEMSLSDDIREMGDMLEESAEFFDGADPTTADELRELAEELARAGTASTAETAAHEINAGDVSSANASGETVSAELRDLADGLDAIRQRYNMARKQELLREIDEAVERSMRASRQCEELTREAARGPTESFPRRQERLAEEIRGLREAAADIAEQTLFLPGEVAGALDEAANEVSAAGANAELGNPREAYENDRRALAALNAVTMALLNARGAVEKSGSSMGLAEMMEQMKGLAEAQRQMNEESGAAMTMLPGMQPSMVQTLLERLAAEQAMIRRELGKAAKRAGEYAETMGNAASLIEEMKEIEETLRRGKLDERVLEKQEKLLERMLDSTRAMRSKGKSSKRRSEPAKEYTPFGVPRTVPSRLTAPKRTEAPGWSGADPGYVPPAYRDAAAEYYRRLAGGD